MLTVVSNINIEVVTDVGGDLYLLVTIVPKVMWQVTGKLEHTPFNTHYTTLMSLLERKSNYKLIKTTIY